MSGSERRHGTARRSLISAIVLLATVPLLGFDLWRSVHEHRAVEAWTLCSLDAQGPCLTSEPVTLEGPESQRKTRLREWRARGSDGDLTQFDLLPASDDQAANLSGDGTLYRYDGKVVAVAGKNGRMPTALSGSHAIAVDTFALLAVLGSVLLSTRTVRAARRRGLTWSDPILEQERSRLGLEHAALYLGLFGVAITFMIAVAGAAAWLISAALTAPLWLLEVFVRKPTSDARTPAP